MFITGFLNKCLFFVLKFKIVKTKYFLTGKKVVKYKVHQITLLFLKTENWENFFLQSSFKKVMK